MLLVVVSDPVGIRTRDPQLRRLLLYPAELPDLVGMRLSMNDTFRCRWGYRDSSSKPKLAKFGLFCDHWSLCISLSAFKEQFACAKARQITHVGTLISAYKGNLGAKVLLFFDLCKFKAKKLQKFLKKFL